MGVLGIFASFMAAKKTVCFINRGLDCSPLITGGSFSTEELHSGPGIMTGTVLKFNSKNLNDDPEEMESMLNARSNHACAIFESTLHEGRPVIIVAGGDASYSTSGKEGLDSAEVWDFTMEDSSWQESNLIFVLYVQRLMNVHFM